MNQVFYEIFKLVRKLQVICYVKRVTQLWPPTGGSWGASTLGYYVIESATMYFELFLFVLTVCKFMINMHWDIQYTTY